MFRIRENPDGTTEVFSNSGKFLLTITNKDSPQSPSNTTCMTKPKDQIDFIPRRPPECSPKRDCFYTPPKRNGSTTPDRNKLLKIDSNHRTIFNTQSNRVLSPRKDNSPLRLIRNETSPVKRLLHTPVKSGPLSRRNSISDNPPWMSPSPSKSPRTLLPSIGSSTALHSPPRSPFHEVNNNRHYSRSHSTSSYSSDSSESSATGSSCRPTHRKINVKLPSEKNINVHLEQPDQPTFLGLLSLQPKSPNCKNPTPNETAADKPGSNWLFGHFRHLFQGLKQSKDDDSNSANSLHSNESQSETNSTVDRRRSKRYVHGIDVCSPLGTLIRNQYKFGDHAAADSQTNIMKYNRFCKTPLSGSDSINYGPLFRSSKCRYPVTYVPPKDSAARRYCFNKIQRSEQQIILKTGLAKRARILKEKCRPVTVRLRRLKRIEIRRWTLRKPSMVARNASTLPRMRPKRRLLDCSVRVNDIKRCIERRCNNLYYIIGTHVQVPEYAMKIMMAETNSILQNRVQVITLDDDDEIVPVGAIIQNTESRNVESDDEPEVILSSIVKKPPKMLTAYCSFCEKQFPLNGENPQRVIEEHMRSVHQGVNNRAVLLAKEKNSPLHGVIIGDTKRHPSKENSDIEIICQVPGKVNTQIRDSLTRNSGANRVTFPLPSVVEPDNGALNVEFLKQQLLQSSECRQQSPPWPVHLNANHSVQSPSCQIPVTSLRRFNDEVILLN